MGILYADIDLSAVGTARRPLDVAGHYSRPDIFELKINAKPQKAIEIERIDETR